MRLLRTYYTVKYVLPRSMQLMLRRHLVRRKVPRYADRWPIDENAYNPPDEWSGWPAGKQFALVVTHDVETRQGVDKCYPLAEIDERMGVRSSFNFVIADYEVPVALRHHLTTHGFEIGIHGVHHNNNPFRSEAIFRKQAVTINHHLKAWGAVGFRSPSMYHDLRLLHHLDIEYDASTFDTDPFEPQPDGMGTIFPFWVPGSDGHKGYVELPYTLPQDFLLYILLQKKGIEIWKQKLDWIVAHGGMVLFITHPDYMNFGNTSHDDLYPAVYYTEFLEYITSKYDGMYWNALPRDVSRFWVRTVTGKDSKGTIPTGTHVSRYRSPDRDLSSVSRAIIIDPMHDPRWNEFVARHPLGLICHRAEWKQVLEESFPHMKGHYLTLLDDDSQLIRAALPIFEVKSMLTGKRLVSIPFATTSDPLISSAEDMRELLDAAIQLSTTLGCSKIEIKASASSPLMTDSRLCGAVHYNSHQLSLETAPEELLTTYSRKARWTIKKSMKSGLELEVANDERDLVEFYNLYVKTRKRLGLPPQP